MASYAQSTYSQDMAHQNHLSHLSGRAELVFATTTTLFIHYIMKNLEISVGMVEFYSYCGVDYTHGRDSIAKYTLVMDDVTIEWKSDKSYFSPQEVIDHVLPLINTEKDPLLWEWIMGRCILLDEKSKENSSRYGYSISETKTFEVFVS